MCRLIENIKWETLSDLPPDISVLIVGPNALSAGSDYRRRYTTTRNFPNLHVTRVVVTLPNDISSIYDIMGDYFPNAHITLENPGS